MTEKDLEIAIKKLEQFSTGNLFAIDLAKYLISGKAREEKEKEHALVQHEVQSAAEVVKKNYLLIQKLNRGTPEQQALAASAMQAVERYNAVLAETRKRPPTWSARISRYLYEKCGLTLTVQPIHIPQQASVQKRYSKSSASASSKKIALSIQQGPVLKQEDEAFRVKAISLLRNHGIRFTSPSEEFDSIRSTPIQATQEGKRVQITQILNPFPGETIAFKGEFERDAERSIPIADSFEVSTTSDQTGFPHPSQHNGWALAHQMLPICPHHPELLPKFHPLYIQKQQIAQELLPEGKLITDARTLLKSKKLQFTKNCSQLLQKHEELNAAIGLPKKVVGSYFKTVKTFESHCEVQELILSHFIVRPYEKVQEYCLNHPSPQPKKLTAIYQQEIHQALQENSLEYISHLGPILGSAACSIILQHLSEAFGFIPPMLSDFELKVQTALYKQLLDFHAELKHPEISLEKILRQLDDEIALFRADSFDDLDLPAVDYVKELELYFMTQTA